MLYNVQNETRQQRHDQTRLRIGIVGGGIMGITVAHSLAKSLQKQQNSHCDIVVYEGDSNGGGMNQFNQNKSVPSWNAATARNANTIAVGAAMHVFASRSVVWNVVSESANGAFTSVQQNLFSMMPKAAAAPVKLARMDDFNITPPYFAFHPSSCMGPGVPSAERQAFVRFISNFLYTTVFNGGMADCKDRGRTLVQLANASRHVFLTDVAQTFSCTSNQYTEGLLSVHRTQDSAQHALDECDEFGEPARMLSWEEAIRREPRLERFPIQNPLYAVLRVKDIAANCEEYIRRVIDDTKQLGVAYETHKVTKIDYCCPKETRSYYSIQFETGESAEVDLLVLAAGAETPLLAEHLGVGKYVPTYPLRGYSYTVVTEKPFGADHSKTNLLLQTAFTMDRMYMSSVKPWMARITGFAELAGFRDSARDVGSQAPQVMTRYANALFGDKKVTNIREETALQCFRPMSPDDLPVVGAIPTKQGLFVHTGHGTLGWTTAFATAACVSQDILDHIRDGDDCDESTPENRTFVLPNGTEIDRKILSPGRFVWFS